MLGKPDRVEGPTLVYRRTDPERDPTPTTLSIRLVDDRVERMTWSYYVE